MTYSRIFSVEVHGGWGVVGKDDRGWLFATVVATSVVVGSSRIKERQAVMGCVWIVDDENRIRQTAQSWKGREDGDGDDYRVIMVMGCGDGNLNTNDY